MEIKTYLNNKRIQVEDALETLLPPETHLFSTHYEAMRYSLFAGGKRIRPVLCIMAAEAFGKNLTENMAIPCALECIHTYSLIHDDLPAMDDDDLRRGKPTNHTIYGEAQAILSGDGLLTFAFELLSRPAKNDTLSADQKIQIINVIATAAGSPGMVGGQSLDVSSEGKEVPFSTLQAIHRAKTGALITASVQSGAILGGASESEYDFLTTYGSNLGLAFQITDDLLNVEGTPEELGKAAGSDEARQKATYPAFFGVEETREKAKEAVHSALSSLETFDHRAEPLRELAHYILKRRK